MPAPKTDAAREAVARFARYDAAMTAASIRFDQLRREGNIFIQRSAVEDEELGRSGLAAWEIAEIHRCRDRAAVIARLNRAKKLPTAKAPHPWAHDEFDR